MAHNNDSIELTKKILSIESPTGHERPLAEYLKDVLDSIGLSTQLIAHSKTSASLLAKSSGRQMLCINCHLDVVPYVNNPLKEDGRYIYGKGSVDTKKDVGPVISALSSLKDIPDGIVLAFDADEEYSNTGASQLVGKITAPTVVVNEPTNMEVHIGFRGWTEVAIETHGEQVHSCYARRDDAYSKMVSGLNEIIQNGFMKEDECGEVGVAVGTFPLKRKDDAYIPSISRADLLILNNTVYNTRDAILNEIARCSPWLDARIESLWPAFMNKKSKIGQKLAMVGNFKMGVHKAWTNANFFTDRDIVIFGCGDPTLGHTNNEKVEKKQLLTAEKTYKKIFSEI